MKKIKHIISIIFLLSGCGRFTIAQKQNDSITYTITHTYNSEDYQLTYKYRWAPARALKQLKFVPDKGPYINKTLVCFPAFISIKNENNETVGSMNGTYCPVQPAPYLKDNADKWIANALKGQTTGQYGAWMLSLPDALQIIVLDSLHSSYTRDGITASDWTIGGRSRSLDSFATHNKKVLLTVRAIPKPGNTVVSFTKDTATLKTKTADILSRYNPEVICYENEELNDAYYKGPVSDYIAGLKAIASICHEYNTKVCDGGLTRKGLAYLIYFYYRDTLQNPDKAERWKAYNFNSKMVQTLTHSNAADWTLIRRFDTLVQAMKTLPVDYVNIHWYENQYGDTVNITPGADKSAIEELSDYIHAVTGKDIITNECGEIGTTSVSLVTQSLNAYKSGGYKYVIWFGADANNSEAKGLCENNGVLRANGIAFRDWVIAH